MTAKNNWIYRGHTVTPITYAGNWSAGLRWRIIGYHQTGLVWDEENSPKFATKKEVREYIDQIENQRGE